MQSAATVAAEQALADVKQNANVDKFAQPSTDAEYQEAVELVKSRLNNMQKVKAIVSLNLGTNQPDIIIDARTPNAKNN